VRRSGWYPSLHRPQTSVIDVAAGALVPRGKAMAPQLLARQCETAQPHTGWVGDITDVWTADGGEYRAGLLDL
jgi:transposase InsO family protein